jgi:hypothetical protein
VSSGTFFYQKALVCIRVCIFHEFAVLMFSRGWSPVNCCMFISRYKGKNGPVVYTHMLSEDVGASGGIATHIKHLAVGLCESLSLKWGKTFSTH